MLAYSDYSQEFEIGEGVDASGFRNNGLRIWEDKLEIPASFAGDELELAPTVPGSRSHLVASEAAY